MLQNGYVSAPGISSEKGIDICRFKRSLDNIDTLLYMKLSRFAVLQSVIIVYTIGDIAALLCLQNQCAAFDGMYASRIDLEEISLMYRHFADEIAPLMIADHFLHFCLVFCIVSDNNFCTPVRSPARTSTRSFQEIHSHALLHKHHLDEPGCSDHFLHQ